MQIYLWRVKPIGLFTFTLSYYNYIVYNLTKLLENVEF